MSTSGFDPKRTYSDLDDPNSRRAAPPVGRFAETCDFIGVVVNGFGVGMIQSITPIQNRPVNPVYEIGNIYPVELVPQNFSGTIECSRVTLFKNDLISAIYRGDVSRGGPPIDITKIQTIADITFPMDIQMITINPLGPPTIREYTECWITSYRFPVTAGNKIITESASFAFRRITNSPSSSFVAPTTQQEGAGQLGLPFKG